MVSLVSIRDSLKWEKSRFRVNTEVAHYLRYVVDIYHRPNTSGFLYTIHIYEMGAKHHFIPHTRRSLESARDCAARLILDRLQHERQLSMNIRDPDPKKPEDETEVEVEESELDYDEDSDEDLNEDENEEE